VAVEGWRQPPSTVPSVGVQVRVALDLQALQPGTGAEPDLTERVARWAAALFRSGRLAAGLLAPEFPPPDPERLPEGLYDQSLLDWDTPATARRLMAAGPGLVHHVPAPWLQSAADAPAGLIFTRHWTGSRALLVVTRDGRPDGAPAVRAEGRWSWMDRADLALWFRDRAEVEEGGLALGPVPLSGEAWDAAVATVLNRLDGMASRPLIPPVTRVALFGPFAPAGGGIGAYNARLVALAAGGPVSIDAVMAVDTSWVAPAGTARLTPESFGSDVRPASYDAVVYTLGNSDGHLATVEAALAHPGWLWLHEARLPAVATAAFTSLPDSEYERRLTALVSVAYPGRAPSAAVRASGRDHMALSRAGVGLIAPLAERATGILVNSEAARRAVLFDLTPMAWHPPVVVLPPACPPLRDSGRIPDAGGRRVVGFGVVSMSKRPDLLVDAAARCGVDLAFVGPCPPVLQQLIEERAARRGIADRVTVTGAVDDETWWEWMGRADLAVQLRDSGGGEMSAAVLDALSSGLPVLTSLASAEDWPVAHLADQSADGLAAAIDDLLGDPDRRASLSAAAQGFAATHQVEHLVGALWSAILGSDVSGAAGGLHR
jgi:glycosyltransferase involved in cell wall biosynthesis